MATWIAHMRIAEHFMKLYDRLNCEEFLVGNIGPDCGVPNEDWSKFTPSGKITHWMKDGANIDAEDFKSKYIFPDNDSYPFYLGYYFHLLTDIEWNEKVYGKKKLEPLYYEGLNADPGFIWIIKKDWYGQDHVYLQNNPDSIFFRVFQHINEFENAYFDFYPPEAFIRQIRHITNFYLTAEENTDREFPYLSKDEMDSFVRNTIKELENTKEAIYDFK